MNGEVNLKECPRAVHWQVQELTKSREQGLLLEKRSLVSPTCFETSALHCVM